MPASSRYTSGDVIDSDAFDTRAATDRRHVTPPSSDRALSTPLGETSAHTTTIVSPFDRTAGANPVVSTSVRTISGPPGVPASFENRPRMGGPLGSRDAVHATVTRPPLRATEGCLHDATSRARATPWG